MVMLAFLAEAPMHAYRMHELIKLRGKDSVVNVSQRNSVYQTIERLLRTELIGILETSRQEGRPERVVYQITDAGRATLHEWVVGMLAEPVVEFPEFPAALATIAVLSQEEAQQQLERRVLALEQQLAASNAAAGEAISLGIPRLFLIEDEYKRAIMNAEIAWINSLINDFRDATIAWDEEWLRQIALSFSQRGTAPD